MFREEVFESKKKRLYGNVIMTQPFSFYFKVAFVFMSFFLIFIYLNQYSYTRKESVKGYLTPKKGLVKVYLNREGIIEELMVSEGKEVKIGDGLAKIKNSQSLSSGEELSESISNELKKQKIVLTNEISILKEIKYKDNLKLENQLIKLYKSYSSAKKLRETSLKKLKIKKDNYLINRDLKDKGFLSRNEFLVSLEEYLNAQENVDRLDQNLVSIELEISIKESEKNSLPENLQLKLTTIERQISSINTQLYELNNQYEFIKKAPESGIVTAIQSYVGSNVNLKTPLLSIIPKDSPLELEMLLPTRSSGFVQVGDHVNIRFDAFPYQKFGMVKGTIISVDKALLLPSDKALPFAVNEAMYQVRAELDNQTVLAYGKSYPLKVGMIADADIILEKRSLLDWLLEPLYSVKGRF